MLAQCKQSMEPAAAFLAQFLQQQEKYLLLIIDEVELMWSSKFPLADMKMLHSALTSLASDETGRTTTIICGSSASLPSLIHQSSIDALESRFPYVRHLPSLNNTKFRAYHLSAADPCDLTLTQRTLEVLRPEFKELDVNTQSAVARLICLLAGNNPGRVQQFLEDIGRMSGKTLLSISEVVARPRAHTRAQ